MRIASRALTGVLVTLVLSACSPEDAGRIEFGPKPLFDPIVLPTSSTGSAIVPLPFDGLYGTDGDLSDEDGTATDADDNIDGTLNLAALLGEAALVGAGQSDGWSTTAPLFTDLTGPLDPAVAADGIRIFDTVRFRELQPGTDFLVEVSPVVFGRTRLLVQWLTPLPESTQFLVALTTDIRGPSGAPGIVNEVFELLRNETPVSQQQNSILQSLLLAGRGDEIATLEALQAQLVQPVLAGIEGLSAAAPNSRGAISRADVTLAWSFTTQSISPTFDAVVASIEPTAMGVVDSGLDMSAAIAAATGSAPTLAVDADVYVGTLDLPYYLSDDPAEINTTFFVNDGNVTGATHPALGAPCGALLRPASTTICYPQPVQRSTQTVPVVLTRPQTQMPPGGWPVAIFSHGVTGNRSQMFGIAPALAQAGVVAVAIDHPLHGLPPGSPLRIPGVQERTFDADLDGDGTPEDSGTYFINLPASMTLRDNGRQAVFDQLQLIASLENVRLGEGGSEMLNTDRISYIGHSLGALVGTGVVAAEPNLSAAALAFPGGMVTKLLDGSDTFGPIVAAGFEAVGVIEGTDTYENLLILTQTGADPSDPINYVADAVASSIPVVLFEAVGDTVVPNSVVNNPQAVQNGYLAGTDPMVTVGGLPTTTVTAGDASPQILSGDNHIEITNANHGSIVLPTTANPLDDPAFVEIQRQAVSFVASGGLCLPIATSCPQ